MRKESEQSRVVAPLRSLFAIATHLLHFWRAIERTQSATYVTKWICLWTESKFKLLIVESLCG